MLRAKVPSMSKKTYEKQPEVPEAMRERYRVMLEVLSGKLTVSEGARQLGLSRNHFQTLMHRGLAAMVEAMTPKAPGRPPMPAKEVELAAENDRLKRDNERLRTRVDTIDRLLNVASDMLQGRVSARPRGKKSTAGSTTNDDGDDPESRRRARLRGARAMRACGMRAPIAAAIVGASPQTLRRWSARDRRGELLARHAGPREPPPLDAHRAAHVEDLVRDLRGLVGAESLRRSVPGVSRRQAAAVKREALIEMERERKARTGHVVVTQPGVLRGFDQLYARTTEGLRTLLVSADGAVPYRTSIEPVARYDGAHVAAALEHDIAQNGAPLVWRRDRASAHATDEVCEVLDAHGVLPVDGPPRCPRFYGQLERQNREHRAWLEALDPPAPDALGHVCDRMRSALNGAWRRPTLGWRTAAEAWQSRPAVEEDRTALRDEVHERAARIERDLAGRGAYRGLAWRLAVEHALTQRGYLRLELGARC
jgi:transposase-like protein